MQTKLIVSAKSNQEAALKLLSFSHLESIKILVPLAHLVLVLVKHSNRFLHKVRFTVNRC